jgi:transposase
MINIEVRKKILSAHQRGISIQTICHVMDVKQRAVYKLLEQERKTGSIEPQTHTRGRKPLLLKEHLNKIQEFLVLKSDATLQEIKECLILPVEKSALSNAIRKLGFRYKKKRYMQVSEIAQK